MRQEVIDSIKERGQAVTFAAIGLHYAAHLSNKESGGAVYNGVSYADLFSESVHPAERAARFAEARAMIELDEHLNFGVRDEFGWVRQLKSGDRVYWNDPDDGICSRAISIGTIDVIGDRFTITDGSVVEGYLSELEPI